MSKRHRDRRLADQVGAEQARDFADGFFRVWRERVRHSLECAWWGAVVNGLSNAELQNRIQSKHGTLIHDREVLERLIRVPDGDIPHDGHPGSWQSYDSQTVLDGLVGVPNFANDAVIRSVILKLINETLSHNSATLYRETILFFGDELRDRLRDLEDGKGNAVTSKDGAGQLFTKSQPAVRLLPLAPLGDRNLWSLRLEEL